MKLENTLRQTHTVDLHFDASPEVVFPLLCPVREYEWIADWNCRMVYTASGIAEAGAIFRTSFPEKGDEVWTVSRYEPHQAIAFLVVAWNVMVTELSFELEAEDEGRTLARVRHTFTALSDAGARAVAARTPEIHERDVRVLEVLVNHFLATGQALAPVPRAREMAR
jgi:hypothetical protein